MSVLDWWSKKIQRKDQMRDEEVIGPKRPEGDTRLPRRETGADWRSFYVGKVKSGWTPYGWKREESGGIKKKMFYVPNPKKQKQEREQLKTEYLQYLAGKYGREV